MPAWETMVNGLKRYNNLSWSKSFSNWDDVVLFLKLAGKYSYSITRDALT